MRIMAKLVSISHTSLFRVHAEALKGWIYKNLYQTESCKFKKSERAREIIILGISANVFQLLLRENHLVSIMVYRTGHYTTQWIILFSFRELVSRVSLHLWGSEPTSTSTVSQELKTHAISRASAHQAEGNICWRLRWSHILEIAFKGSPPRIKNSNTLDYSNALIGSLISRTLPISFAINHV